MAPLPDYARRILFFYARLSWRHVDHFSMIRLLFAFLLFLPSVVFACITGNQITVSGTIPSAIGAYCHSDACSYTVLESVCSGTDCWSHAVSTGDSCTPPPPCADGSYPPGGDVAQCPHPTCPDGSYAPFGDVNLCSADQGLKYHCPDGTTVTDPSTCPPVTPPEQQVTNDAAAQAIIGTIREENRYQTQVIQSVANIMTEGFNYLGRKIDELKTSLSTQPLAQAIDTLSGSISGGMSAISGQIATSNIYLSQILAQVAQSAVNLQSTLGDLYTRGVQELYGQVDRIMTGLDNANNRLQGIIGQITAVQTEIINNALSTATTISQATDSITDTIDTSITNLGTTLTDISQQQNNLMSYVGDSLNAMASAFNPEAMAGVMSGMFTSALAPFQVLGNAIATGIDNLHLTISDGIFDLGNSIDSLTDTVSSFMAGEETAYSTAGNTALNTPRVNPLDSTDEVDVSTIINTTATGGGSCPAPATAEVLGQTLTFSYDHICDWAQIIGKLVMIIAAFASIRIFAGGL